MDEFQQSDPKETAPNLILLKVLCIFTFIGSGLGFISYGVIGLVHDYFVSNLALIANEKYHDVVEMLLAAGRLFIILNALLYGVSFTGAVMLWKMKKVGFHLYTSAQLLLLILPMIFIKGFPMDLGTIFLTLLFVWGYSGYMKFMN